MPNARMDAALPGFQVKKVAWRHMLRRSCLVVPEVDPDVGLIRALVRREPNVPVDSRDGSTERAGVPDDVRTDLLQAVPGVADETHGRLEHDRLELSLVRIEPFLAVVFRQTPEEIEELRREVLGSFPHGTLLLKASRSWIAVQRLNIGAKGRASKTTRIDPILSPRTRYHSQMNAVPAGVFVTISYRMHTSFPSTKVFFGSTRSTLW